MVIKILTGVKRDMDEHSHNLNREIEKYQTEVIIELENTLEGSNSRLDEIEAWISELEDKAKENTQTEQQNNNRIKGNDDTLRDLGDNNKQNNIHVIGVPEGEEK